MSIKDKINKYKEIENMKTEKSKGEAKSITDRKKIFEEKQPEKKVEKIVAPKDETFKEKLDDWKTLEEMEKKIANKSKIKKPKKLEEKTKG